MQHQRPRQATLPALDFFSESFPPTGGIFSEGVRNALGRPRMDLLEVLLRETVQNSWDAKLAPGIRYGMHGWRLTEDQLRALRNLLMQRPSRGLPLGGILREDKLDVLAIVDRGTRGLDGPARADAVAAGSTNFIDLVRNVGRVPDRQHGGGTYGYGKGVLFLASGARTILVHSRFSEGGRLRSRLMAAALGEHFDERRRGRMIPFTGRHWWGHAAGDGVIDPVADPRAGEFVSRLGLPSFNGLETGTTILLIAPLLEEPGPAALARVAHMIASNFWPKMIPRAGRGSDIQFELSWDGEAVEIPDPTKLHPFSGYVRALEHIHSLRRDGSRPEDATILPIVCERPRQEVGQLSLERVSAGGTTVRPSEVLESPHHVALLRTPELVVRYLEGPAVPDGAVGWVGVFLAADELDSIFARAEPPTHDDWIPDMLEDRRERTLVRVALRRIAERVREFLLPVPQQMASGTELPLGAISSRLAGLVSAELGLGGLVPPGSMDARERDDREGGPVSGSRGRRAQVMVTGPGRLCLINGLPAVEIEVEVLPVPGSESTRISIDLGVATDDGSSVESEPPLGATRPSLISWRGPKGQLVEGQQPLEVAGDSSQHWIASVRLPEDSVLRAIFRAERVGR